MSLCIWMRYAILIHRSWQLWWQFYVFDWVTLFLHRDMQVSRRLYGWNKTPNIYRVDVCHFPGTLWETDSTCQCSMLSLARNNKNPKITKNRLAQKFCYRDNLLFRCVCEKGTDFGRIEGGYCNIISSFFGGWGWGWRILYHHKCQHESISTQVCFDRS